MTTNEINYHIKMAHDKIIRAKGKDYAPTVYEIQEEIDKSEKPIIPGISDEEIIQNGIKHYQKLGWNFGPVKTEIWYMAIQWYREQLKQRQ